MLILTRKIGESIIINHNIQVKIINVDHYHNQVRLGIEAPEAVQIYREEIHHKIKGALAEAKSPAKLTHA